MHNHQHNLTMVQQQKMTNGAATGNYMDLNHQLYFNNNSSLRLQENNGIDQWCNDPSSSIFSNGFRRSTPDSLLHQRSGVCSIFTGYCTVNLIKQTYGFLAWSCGFEEVSAYNAKAPPAPPGFVNVVGAGVGAIGTPRPNGFMQMSRQSNGAPSQQPSNQINGSLCNDVSNWIPKTTPSAGSAGFPLNDINVWNMDQLCRRVTEAAIE